jgi:hypothetical protein
MVTLRTTPGGLPVDRRKEAFRDLVEAQDRGLSVPDSRRVVAARYELTEAEVRAVEEEGVKKEWPPL